MRKGDQDMVEYQELYDLATSSVTEYDRSGKPTSEQVAKRFHEGETGDCDEILNFLLNQFFGEMAPQSKLVFSGLFEGVQARSCVCKGCGTVKIRGADPMLCLRLGICSLDGKRRYE